MSSIFSASAPKIQQVSSDSTQQQIEERDIDKIENMRRRNQTASLLQLLSDESTSPTIL